MRDEGVFLSRDRDEAIEQIKEKLYARLYFCQRSMELSEASDSPLLRGMDFAVEEEIAFLNNLLDIIERS